MTSLGRTAIVLCASVVALAWYVSYDRPAPRPSTATANRVAPAASERAAAQATAPEKAAAPLGTNDQTSFSSREKNSTAKDDWSRPRAQPASPERERALAVALRRLSANDANAAAEAWLALPPAERTVLVAAALTETARHSSDDAVREAIRFCDEDPAYALEYGRSLITALADRTDYSAALGFVLAEESSGWLQENGHKWLTSLFTRWSDSAPREAADAAQNSVGPALRGDVLQTVAAVWAKTDPASAAEFAWRLAEPDRAQVLELALRQWSDTHPTAAMAWLTRKQQAVSQQP